MRLIAMAFNPTSFAIKVVDQIDSGSRGSLQLYAIAVRVTDATGIPLDKAPTVTVMSGGGGVVSVFADDSTPYLYNVNVRLGPIAGDNVYRVTSGDVSKDVTIPGT